MNRVVHNIVQYGNYEAKMNRLFNTRTRQLNKCTKI